MDERDAELMDAARASLEPPLAAELEAHLADLRAFVHLRLGSALRTKEESQDLVQSVCREVLAELPRDEPRRGSFRDWLMRAAENKIRDRWRYWRREKRESGREVELDGAHADADAGLFDLFTPSRHAASREDLARLERAFCRLPADQREVIVLARLRGWTHERIAERMGRTELATRSLLSRALARLAIAMEA